MANLQDPRENQSLTSKVFRYIRDGILEGRYQSGDALVETKLAEELGVSRTPIREALKQLELEDLIESVPNRGVVVKAFSTEDIHDIFTIRHVLEGLAASWAAERIQQPALDKLAELIELMELYTRRQDFSNLARLDSEFHDVIFSAASSRTLKHILASLHQNAAFARQTSLMHSDRAKKSLLEHKEIYAALQSHNAADAKLRMEQHILLAGQQKTNPPLE